MDATCAIQNSIHVFSLVHINMCPGFWVHIKPDWHFTGKVTPPAGLPSQ